MFQHHLALHDLKARAKGKPLALAKEEEEEVAAEAVARPSDPANVSSAAHAEPVQPGSSGQVIPDQGISPVALMVDGYDSGGLGWPFLLNSFPQHGGNDAI